MKCDRLWLGRCLLGLALVLASAPARAQETEDQALQQEARSLFEAGRTAFEASRFEAARDYFLRSYEISGRAVLLFNLGAALQRLQENERALDHYRRYLEAVPNAPNRSAVERRIAFLERRLQGDDEAGDASAPLSSSPLSSSDDGGDVDFAPWIVLGAAGLVAAGGIVLVVLSQLEAATVQDSPRGAMWSEYEGAAARADILGVAGWIAIGVGVAGAAGALVWGLAAGDSTEVAFGPGGVELRGRF